MASTRNAVHAQQQSPPGLTALMDPLPDHCEQFYAGHGRLEGKKAVVTGGDSGIGRAVAIAFAREGADVLIAYLEEDEDAAETARWVEQEGCLAPLVRGDLADPSHCRRVIDEAVEAFGRIDVLVNNAAHQRTYAELDEIPDAEWEQHLRIGSKRALEILEAVRRDRARVVRPRPERRQRGRPYAGVACAAHASTPAVSMRCAGGAGCRPGRVGERAGPARARRRVLRGCRATRRCLGLQAGGA